MKKSKFYTALIVVSTLLSLTLSLTLSSCTAFKKTLTFVESNEVLLQAAVVLSVSEAVRANPANRPAILKLALELKADTAEESLTGLSNRLVIKIDSLDISNQEKISLKVLVSLINSRVTAFIEAKQLPVDKVSLLLSHIAEWTLQGLGN